MEVLAGERSFDYLVQQMHRGNALDYEDGFWGLTSIAPDHVEGLIHLALSEQDPFIRVGFIELLGDTRSPKVIEHLRRFLADPDPKARLLAALTLEEMPFPEAQGLVLAYRAEHPDEF